MKDVDALVLCGGQGTRLRSIIADKPKVLAPVNGRPFLSYLLDQLVNAGFRDVILCTGYKGEMVRDAFGPHYKELNIRYSHETEPLGTGGALRYALPMVKSQIVLVMNGDSYIDADLSDFLVWHFDKKFYISMILSEVSDISRYGAVKINDTQIITGFIEKSTDIKPGWVNAGIYLFSRKLIEESIQSNVFYSLEKEMMPSLLRKVTIGGYRCKSVLMDIGTPESYKVANQISDGEKG